VRVKLKLECSEREYKFICEEVEGRGAVLLPRPVIRKLIVDHSRVLAALQELGIEAQYQQMKGG
jgi:hypothetical protein